MQPDLFNPVEHTPKYPTTGPNAVDPPMAGWWGVELDDGGLNPPATSLWWDGVRWFDSRDFWYQHVGVWYGLLKPAAAYDYPTDQKMLLLPQQVQRKRVQPKQELNLLRKRVINAHKLFPALQGTGV